jgi:dipeptidyl aminopeptidase/acylaminoacyl peptidase
MPATCGSWPKPRLFDIANRRQLPLDDALYDNPWEITEAVWGADSAEFSFVYNQRGHQVMRIVGIRADSGSVRAIHEERSKTFIDYSQKSWMRRLPATGEILWASERDGHNHIYLIDGAAGRIKQQVTKGDWEVREVMEVDEDKRQLLLKVVGVTGQDPYHQHFVRVGFNGGALTRLTTGDGNHGIKFSPDRQWLIDTWSRVDLPPVVEIRRAADGKLVAELDRADDAALQGTGRSRPERFTAKGRDGKTDIHGILIRPTRFDPAKKYPVVEEIYAGPHDHFVAKNYFPWSNKNALAELGFIVVSIDGMGTNWRGKAFQDVCWKNLADSGFPDRIAWIKAAAASRPWMDLTRVGIYGGSAGGQSTLAGLLHHGDFYQVGVADCGCHDNRMDKIWWNEAWMGWPIDDSYARNSNVTHAAKLTGKLLMVVGEIDHNVDPASTAQVAAALQKAGKDFEMLTIMNSDHGAAESPYGKYRRAEFLVRNLHAAAPPPHAN